jgi:hypothetical protein
LYELLTHEKTRRSPRPAPESRPDQHQLHFLCGF